LQYGHAVYLPPVSLKRGNRHVFKELQKVRRDPAYAEKKPVRVFLDMVAAPLEADDEDMEDSIRAAIRRSGYKARRQAITRSVGVWSEKSVTMDHVFLEYRISVMAPRSFSIIFPGFISITPWRKACEAGLHAIVADGTHTLHPKKLGTTHSCIACSVEVPLIFCIRAKKTEKIYSKTFENLKASITSDAPRRVILDFKKAAISAARKTFPGSSIEGCAFHIAQAWNRKRNDSGLKKFTQEPQREDRCSFLALIPRVKALRAPPVPTGHAAYGDCESFLRYFDATWLQDTFKNCGANVKRLGFLIGVEHPPLSVLIEALHKLNYETRAALKRLEEYPNDARVLEKKDQERRAKIAEEMESFADRVRFGKVEFLIRRWCAHFLVDRGTLRDGKESCSHIGSLFGFSFRGFFRSKFWILMLSIDIEPI
ncbi:hypothetical protein COOONC_04143, partial [Cooperia oncophora]